MRMREIKGNTKGLKEVILEELRQLYELEVPASQLITEELGTRLAQLTSKTGREISIFISRGGQVLSVSLGNSNTVELPEMEGRRGADRLCGIRCLHTHPSGNPVLSGVDVSALLANRLDAMVALGVNAENPAKSLLVLGMITGLDPSTEAYESETWGPYSLEDAAAIYFANYVSSVERALAKQFSGTSSNDETKERAILIAMEYGKNTEAWSSEDSLDELAQLADTAGAIVVQKFLQKRPKPDPAFFIGKGKVEELALFAQQENIDLCVFDDELSPAQQRIIEEVTGIRILDRTNLILDIFAQRASTNEGKLQVELAQLQYNLPRIMGQGLVLSRLGGGIGPRGPGETKLEVDRRHIRTRISYLNECLDKIKGVRDLHKVKRTKNQIPTSSLVGYTNAGKSTLLNLLTHSDIYAKDQLFATLDPTTRQLELPDNQRAVLTDTVGFIQRLPHQLVAAFKSTLEVVKDADLLLHVVDVSHPLYAEQSKAVYNVLAELEAQDKNILTVFNKIDRLPAGDGLLKRLQNQPDSVCVSATTGQGIPELLQAIATRLRLRMAEQSYLFPYAEAQLESQIYQAGTVLSKEYLDQGVLIKARLNLEDADKFSKYLYEGKSKDETTV